MTAVFLIRHPETTWNVARRYQGRLDTPLSAEGKRQAEKLVASFSGQRISAVFSSPLSRARHLAQGLAEETRTPLCIDNRLTEMAQGPWEGMVLADIHAQHRDLYHRWYVRPDLVHFPGGESLSQVLDRSQALLAEAMHAFPDTNVVMVTHSVVIQSMVLQALALEPRLLHNIRVSNCGVTTLCGTTPPGSVFTLNSIDAIHSSPISGADANGCSTWQPRRNTT